MNPLSRIAKAVVTGSLRRLGLVVARNKTHFAVPRTQYGVSAWEDVKRLSSAMGRPVSTCFDVGAHRGQISQEMLDAFPSAEVFAFEPHPATFADLCSRVASPRFRPTQVALSNVDGDRDLHVYADSTISSLSPNARFAKRFALQGAAITVRSTTLDAFSSSQGIEQIDLLKIDTEGHDLSVLEGAQRMLSERRIGFVYTEFNDCGQRKGTVGGALQETSEFLVRHDFRFVATYTDYIVPEGDLFAVANLLMVRGN